MCETLDPMNENNWSCTRTKRKDIILISEKNIQNEHLLRNVPNNYFLFVCGLDSSADLFYFWGPICFAIIILLISALTPLSCFPNYECCIMCIKILKTNVFLRKKIKSQSSNITSIFSQKVIVTALVMGVLGYVDVLKLFFLTSPINPNYSEVHWRDLETFDL